MLYVFTKMQLNGPDKRNQEEVVVTKICFYGSAEKLKCV